MYNTSQSVSATMALNSGALAIGSTTSQISTGAIGHFVINGRAYRKAITDNIAISYTGPSVYGAATNGSFTGATGGSTRLYGLYMDTAGAVSLEPGPIANTAELSAGTAALHFPGAKRGLTCFGVMRIAVTANTTFIPGTTALGAAGVTTTYINMASHPGGPI